MPSSMESEEPLKICVTCSLKFFESISLNHERIVIFLIKHGILKEFTNCINCKQICRLENRELMFYCSNKKDKKSCCFKKSAIVGSFMEKSNLSMEVKFKLICVLLYINPPRSQLIQRELGLGHHTILHFYSYCQQVFANHIIHNSSILGGPKTVVEIFEAKYITNKYDSWKNKITWAFGGIQHDKQKCFLVPVESCDADTLLGVIEEWLSPGTTAVSICWEKYDCFSHGEFKNLKNNNILTFKNKYTGIRTRAIEGCWRQVRGYKTYNGKKNILSIEHLAEFLFKWKYPKHAERLHHYFSSAAAIFPPQC